MSYRPEIGLKIIPRVSSLWSKMFPEIIFPKLGSKRPPFLTHTMNLMFHNINKTRFLVFVKNWDHLDPNFGKIISGNIFDHKDDNPGVILSEFWKYKTKSTRTLNSSYKKPKETFWSPYCCCNLDSCFHFFFCGSSHERMGNHMK